MISPDFQALPLSTCSDAALEEATRAGAEWTDVRVARESSRHLDLRDGELEGSGVDEQTAIGVRVIVNGAWGFAATNDVSPEAAALAAQRAVAMAKRTSALVSTPVQLADEAPVHGEWVMEYDIDPVDVPAEEVAEKLGRWSAQMAGATDVHHTAAEYQGAREILWYADSSGSRTLQQRVRCQGQVNVTTITPDGFEDMATTMPPSARGWEYLNDPTWEEQLAALPEHLAERVAARSVAPGRYDLVIAPSNLWLTIHESVGHATEFDRTEGYEANYAGTSFASKEQLGVLQYGSPLMHVTGDRTVAGGLATVAWDHEGVPATSWDIVSEGRLVGFQVDRWGAARLGLERSNGCAYADHGTHVQLQRMPNISLQPASDGPNLSQLVSHVEHGLLVIGDKSWSIDMNRRNFQFTAQRFLLIQAGRIVGQVKDAAYQSDTLEFWRSLVALGGPETYQLGGAMNCGKGQPGQVAAVSHGCPAAVFEGVRVLNTSATA